MYVCMYACINMCFYECMRMTASVRMFVRMNALYAGVCYVCVCVCACVCVCVARRGRGPHGPSLRRGSAGL